MVSQVEVGPGVSGRARASQTYAHATGFSGARLPPSRVFSTDLIALNFAELVKLLDTVACANKPLHHFHLSDAFSDVGQHKGDAPQGHSRTVKINDCIRGMLCLAVCRQKSCARCATRKGAHGARERAQSQHLEEAAQPDSRISHHARSLLHYWSSLLQ